MLNKQSLQNPYYKKIQYYFWIVLIVFSTIGCSAKQNLVFSSFSSLDKPLSGSKALSLNNQRASCAGYLEKDSLSSLRGSKRLSGGDFLDNKLVKVVSYPFFIAGTSLFSYSFIVDNKPPLYVLLQKLKLCIVL